MAPFPRNRTNLNRTISCVGVGTLPRAFWEILWREFRATGALPTILLMAALDVNRMVHHARTNFDRDGCGVIDATPDPRLLETAIGHAGSSEIAESNRDKWQHLSDDLVDQIGRAHLEARLDGGQFLAAVAMSTGHSVVGDYIFRQIRRNDPKALITGLTVLPENPFKRRRILSGWELFTALRRDGVLSSCLLLDNLSPFITEAGYTMELQDRFAARALASAAVAQSFTPNAPSLAEIGLSLGEADTTFAGMAFTSRALVGSAEPGWWSGLRSAFGERLPLPERGSADVDHLFRQAQIATEIVLTDPHVSATGEPIDLARPHYLVFTLPLSARDRRKWLDFSNRLRTWLSREDALAIPLFASGNGMPLPRRQSAFWLQVSCLYPLSPVPVPIQRLLEDGNGHQATVTSQPRRGRPRGSGRLANGRSDAAELPIGELLATTEEG